MIPAQIFRHVTIEEITSLSTEEKEMLLTICNIINPFDLYKPTVEDPFPHTITFIRTANRDCVVNKIKESINKIDMNQKDVYNSLCQKLSIPVVLENKAITSISGSNDNSGSIKPN